MFNQRCSWVRVLNHALNIITLSCLVIRVYRVWFLYFSAREKLALRGRVPASTSANVSQNNTNDQPESPRLQNSESDLKVAPWFMRRRYFGSNKFLLRLVLGMATTQLLALSIAFLVINFATGAGTDTEDCLSLTVSFFYLIVWSGMSLINAFQLLALLRTEKEIKINHCPRKNFRN